jgi:hypothetical protein
MFFDWESTFLIYAKPFQESNNIYIAIDARRCISCRCCSEFMRRYFSTLF